MLDFLKFHHIGFATDNLDEAKSFFVKLGYSPGEYVFVPSQKVTVCFMNKTGQPQIELIASAGENSPVESILKKSGPGPYHICFSAPDINIAMRSLKNEKFIILNKPVLSNAIDDNNIIFAYKKSYGLIEIVEIKDK
jgi:methylmalonyl-CoA/ethylmalonyl-CoA epimerase